jgi:hypothetical protein
LRAKNRGITLKDALAQLHGKLAVLISRFTARARTIISACRRKMRADRRLFRGYKIDQILNGLASSIPPEFAMV